MKRLHFAGLVPLALAVGCASEPGAAPDGLSGEPYHQDRRDYLAFRELRNFLLF